MRLEYHQTGNLLPGPGASGFAGRLRQRLSLTFLRYAWNFNRVNRERIPSLLGRADHLRVIRFTSRGQVKKYLSAL